VGCKLTAARSRLPRLSAGGVILAIVIKHEPKGLDPNIARESDMHVTRRQNGILSFNEL
jgi:hypothetical protein